MKVLVACEFSGIVREAFRRKGHDAWSCDIVSSLKTGQHIRKPVQKIDNISGFDLLIAHPPCTHLAVSGARWFRQKELEQKDALEFVEFLWSLPINKIAIENPVSIISTKSSLGKPSQIIQPWQFGHGETKKTCLWLKNLPCLLPTDVVTGRAARIHKMPLSVDRAMLRSITYQGIADAMAAQWG